MVTIDGFRGSYVDVRDVAQAHISALQKLEAGGLRLILSAGPHKFQDFGESKLCTQCYLVIVLIKLLSSFRCAQNLGGDWARKHRIRCDKCGARSDI